jgi:8-hydroxy-5-deazaflavin:NADPH oxidoreductase
MNITFIGIGNVGGALADNLAKRGHNVSIAAHDLQSESVRKAVAQNHALKIQTPLEAVKSADTVFLATPFAANVEALNGLGDLIAGKVLVDCTNPVGEKLTHGLKSESSGAEFVQSLAPRARVVKAFTIYGYENFIDSRYPNATELPAMLIAGDDAEAKKTVASLCGDLGWRPVDVGPLASSLHLEHMTLLWIKMARLQGRGAGFVWSILER